MLRKITQPKAWVCGLEMRSRVTYVAYRGNGNSLVIFSSAGVTNWMSGGRGDRKEGVINNGLTCKSSQRYEPAPKRFQK